MSCVWSPTTMVAVAGVTETAVTLGVVSGGGPADSLPPPHAACRRDSASGMWSDDGRNTLLHRRS
ncbi:MAG: hypothetical protein ACT4R6_06130, partial [Gemmatimonadaceae bacterium]